MVDTIETNRTRCPLCEEEISLDLPDWRVPSKWTDVLAHRKDWARISNSFRAHRSIEKAATSLSLSPETMSGVLEFLCMELCGCRATTCVSCLDDYRGEL
jgi:hypothetical protein